MPNALALGLLGMYLFLAALYFFDPAAQFALDGGKSPQEVKVEAG